MSMTRKYSVLLLVVLMSLCAGVQAQTTYDVGGGANDFAEIQTAISAGAVVAGDILNVYSGTYAPVSDLNKALIIQEVGGETALVEADPAVRGGAAVYVYDAGRHATWDGIDIVQNVTGGDGGHNVFVIFNNADASTFTLMNCTVSIDLPGGSVDARVSGFGDKVHAVNVTFTRNDNNGNPGIMIFDGGGDSIIENCTFGPMTDNASGIISVGNPAGTTLTLTGCTFLNLGTATGFHGRGITASDRAQIYNISDCDFGGGTGNGIFAFFAGNAASCPGTVFNFERCKFDGAPAADWSMFYGDGEGVETNFTNCVFIGDAAREMQIFSELKAHSWVFKHCT